MSQHSKLLFFGCRENGPLAYCPVQADLAVQSPDYDVNNLDGPLVLGCILTAPMVPFNALNAGQHTFPWLSLRDGVTAECSSTKTCSLAHTHHEPGFTFNGDLSSEIRATSDRITTYSLKRDGTDKFFNETVGTEPVKSWLEGKGEAQLYMVNRIQVAKGLEISHLTGVHLKSNLGPDVRDQMSHILVPKLGKQVIVGYGLRKYSLRRAGGQFHTDGDWIITPERVYFDPNGGIANLDR
ncbi:unnamed protein product [Clonostachys rhizophaga]|uniref:Uncharacterized protein n=1 Tax=Clonostachys rhizophaga TaxID=160324 RepID=A0A9N9YMR1_9HYPO|nr:unnamed protein product [Clonostachys rhizophaga]